ncbi:MAG: DUF2007 domain-containing protein [Verrucomicrobiales bacterium]|jgi:hypothetical protein|nr:DUF2007 domain-containing protein [Verrucomicrobiales bacterium]
MKELFREPDFTTIGHYQSLLETCGIRTHVKNETVALMGVSEIPIPDTFPALCVVNNEDFERAWELIREHRTRNEALVEFELRCEKCGEVSPGNFDSCWSCETPLKPEEEAEEK